VSKSWPMFTLGALCSMEKGLSPTLKTTPGPFPLVVTADFRRSSESWQIEGPAVCIPLVSSTGHGDAALHRVHYQEGKFALANLLVALVPKDPSICDAKYLYHLLMAQKDILLVPLMQGTANVSLKEKDIAAVEISLPTLTEQQRVVARIEKLAAKIGEAQGLRKQCQTELDLLKQALTGKFYSIERPETIIVNVATVIDPNPSHRYPIYCDDGVPIISTVDFKDADAITTKFAKKVPHDFYFETLGKHGVGKDDIIFSRKGKIGYARLHPSEKLAMTHTLCVIKPNRDKLLPRYLLHYVRSRGFLNYLTETMNKNTGVPTLGLNVIRKAPIIVPSLKEQERIISCFDELQAKIDTVKQLQSETTSELDAMIPSILDKAFQGAL